MTGDQKHPAFLVKCPVCARFGYVTRHRHTVVEAAFDPLLSVVSVRFAASEQGSDSRRHGPRKFRPFDYQRRVEARLSFAAYDHVGVFEA